MLFESTSARVTVRQGGYEILDLAATSYTFSLPCVRGEEVEVEFFNRLAEPSTVAMVTNADYDVEGVAIPVNGSHTFRFTPTEDVDQMLMWTGDRSVLMHFRVEDIDEVEVVGDQ